ncbi:MAG: hypothetical protein DRJ05_12190 [Bacteroidetes bacterium]|nr:MAG: hypothetical protein DRJ05_12190 [Bacteroidota bacterium]
MKKLTLILVLTGFFLSANAQDNIDIVDEGKMWSYLLQGYPPFQRTYYHKFLDDTIIDQLTYLKVWQSLDEYYQVWDHHGYIRSEENGDVYYLDKFFNGGLIYRFDVQVGDNFTINNPYSWEKSITVLSVDSVLVLPMEQYRKRITIGAGLPYEEIWIEGLGSMAGILNSGFHAEPLTGGLQDILCQWQDGTEVFSNPDFTFCFKTTVSTPENQENNTVLTIFPIPLTESSVIKLSKKITDGRIVITDIFGKTVKEIAVSNTEAISIQRNSFSPGVYIVSLYDGVRFVDRVKMIVK